uniref:Uncharacterized protein n=1 Tax=Heterorhabditis bacteriophora TaxID=37862 RepID=A0A1I7W9F6_HETBA
MDNSTVETSILNYINVMDNNQVAALIIFIISI